MSRATPDDQLKFLLNCVKHSNNGKIDFIEVARECSIVSKGAAAKRYERLMKANGIHPNGGPSDKPLFPPVAKGRSKASIEKAAAAKKRKIEGVCGEGLKKNEDDDDDDEDDGSLPFSLKGEFAHHVDSTPIKEELIPSSDQFAQPMTSRAQSGGEIPDIALLNLPKRPPLPALSEYSQSDGPSIFDEFCNPELFSPHLASTKPLSDQQRTPQGQIVDSIADKIDTAAKNLWNMEDAILIVD